MGNDNRERRNQYEAVWVALLNSTDKSLFNLQNTSNQLTYQNAQDKSTTSIDPELFAYISDFTGENKMPLNYHPYVQNQQAQFRNGMGNCEMWYCYLCQEQWPTNSYINLRVKYPPSHIKVAGFYHCISWYCDKGIPRLNSIEN